MWWACEVWFGSDGLRFLASIYHQHGRALFAVYLYAKRGILEFSYVDIHGIVPALAYTIIHCITLMILFLNLICAVLGYFDRFWTGLFINRTHSDPKVRTQAQSNAVSQQRRHVILDLKLTTKPCSITNSSLSIITHAPCAQIYRPRTKLSLLSPLPCLPRWSRFAFDRFWVNAIDNDLYIAQRHHCDGEEDVRSVA